MADGLPERRSIRLNAYDYASSGAYFVTVCAWQRMCAFGHIRDGAVVLNTAGVHVRDALVDMTVRDSHVCLDEYVVMPNHVHAILFLRETDETSAVAAMKKPVGRIVGVLKTRSAHLINERRNTPGQRVWQRNYYEHVIRDESSLNRIRGYIAGNPARWTEDAEHPALIAAGAGARGRLPQRRGPR